MNTQKKTLNFMRDETGKLFVEIDWLPFGFGTYVKINGVQTEDTHQLFLEFVETLRSVVTEKLSGVAKEKNTQIEQPTIRVSSMLIFDSFPDREHAEAFAKQVKRMYRRSTIVCDSQEESKAFAVFQFKLFPPITLVERKPDWSEEAPIDRMVERFGGTFAGT